MFVITNVEIVNIKYKKQREEILPIVTLTVKSHFASYCRLIVLNLLIL